MRKVARHDISRDCDDTRAEPRLKWAGQESGLDVPIVADDFGLILRGIIDKVSTFSTESSM